VELLKALKVLQACPNVEVTEEGWSLRCTFLTASDGGFLLLCERNVMVDFSLIYLFKQHPIPELVPFFLYDRRINVVFYA